MMGRDNRVMSDPTNMAILIDRIPQYDRSELVAEWFMLFGNKPAKNLSSTLLMRVITHEVQSRSKVIGFGPLKASSRRALRKKLDKYTKSSEMVDALGREVCAGVVSGSNSNIPQPALLAPGIQLVREWNGRPYKVEVSKDGFLFDGKEYRSLTAIAKKITGTNWSGPRFFGLNAKRKLSPLSNHFLSHGSSNHFQSSEDIT